MGKDFKYNGYTFRPLGDKTCLSRQLAEELVLTGN